MTGDEPKHRVLAPVQGILRPLLSLGGRIVTVATIWHIPVHRRDEKPSHDDASQDAIWFFSNACVEFSNACVEFMQSAEMKRYSNMHLDAEFTYLIFFVDPKLHCQGKGKNAVSKSAAPKSSVKQLRLSPEATGPYWALGLDTVEGWEG